MAAYIIADTEITPITDQAAYDEYMREVTPMILKFGGRFIVRAGHHQILEEGWSPNRLVIVEFPDMASLLNWYHSAEYAPFLATRRRISTTHLVVVEGC